LVACAAVVRWGDPLAALGRVDELGLARPHDRRVIWRETLPLVRDVWLAGAGTGTYATAMVFYQRTGREYAFNQAHNEYLQTAAEGGLLVFLPLAVAAVAFARLAARRLRADRSGVYRLRAGALAGLAAALVQSCWETGLRLPANALLAAVLAAIAVHDPVAPPASGEPPARRVA
ncbi:MAG TPA: O-antigen ligase family protein, partial [Roseiflexaceae bacterium]|nr:O-antigen ligase family protein [Roseiflexaceae bacterium]